MKGWDVSNLMSYQTETPGRVLHLFAIVTIVAAISVFILYAWLPVG